MRLHEEELILVYGGAISGTLINAVVRLINCVIEIGKMIGSSLYSIIKSR